MLIVNLAKKYLGEVKGHRIVYVQYTIMTMCSYSTFTNTIFIKYFCLSVSQSPQRFAQTYTQLMQSLGYILKKNSSYFPPVLLILFSLPISLPTLPGRFEWTGSGIIFWFCFLNFSLCARIRIRKNSSKITNLNTFIFVYFTHNVNNKRVNFYLSLHKFMHLFN